MEVELGTQVRSSDGQDVGKVTFLILDPEDGHVKTAVIQKGFLLTEDIEVPIDAFEPGREGDVRLIYTADQVRDLPRFDQGDYTTPPPDAFSAWGYPAAAGLLWPVYRLPGPVVQEVPPSADQPGHAVAQQNWDNAVIQEGSDVVSQDGEKVGEVHSIGFDPMTGRPTSLTVRRGFIFTEDFELPGDTIAMVSDRMVYLTLTQEQVRALVEKQGG